jgi:hypothetical protein
MRRESTNGTRNRDFKGQLRLGSERKTSGINRKTIRGKIAKQVVGTSGGLRRMMDWTLWRGRPPPKRKKKLHTAGACNVRIEAPATRDSFAPFVGKRERERKNFG